MYFRFGVFLVRVKWVALALWAVVLVGALTLAPRVFGVFQAGGFSSPRLEAQQAQDLLDQRFGYSSSPIVVVFRVPADGRAPARNDDPRFLEDVDRALERVRALPEVAWVSTPRENPHQASADGIAAYAVVAVRAPTRQLRETLPRVRAALQQTELDQVITGGPVFFDDLEAVTERGLRRAEAISLPLAAIALLVAFGSVTAAGLPVVAGGASVLVTLGTMVLLGRVLPLSVFSINLVSMLGLGLGIDYSLFVVSRFREELAREEGAGAVERAIGRTMETSGRAVLFSGATVFTGLLALSSFDFPAIRSLGVAGSVVVLASVLAALTLLPALLAVVGRRIDALTVVRRSGVSRGAWAALSNRVMAHPIAVIIPILAALLLLGAPFMSVRFGAADASILPPDLPSRQGSDLLRRHFGQGDLSAILVVLEGEGPMLTPTRIGQAYDLVQRISRDPHVARVDSIVSIDPRLTHVQYQLIYARPDRIPDPWAEAAVEQTMRDGVLVLRVMSRSNQIDDASKDLVRRLRTLPPPAGLRILVGGEAAGVMDYVEGLYHDFPRALVFVVATSYLLLFALFGSVVLPLKAILMNVLSITASFGALVVVFQDGFLSGLLGFTSQGYVEASLPILLFCLLFGISMDYEVFLLTRIREAYAQSGDNRRSVAEGLERSGGIITTAAMIIVLVSGAFVAVDIVLIKALAFGAALAVFLDATLVRALLVPATMRLLGDWNWWVPAGVRRVLGEWRPQA